MPTGRSFSDQALPFATTLAVSVAGGLLAVSVGLPAGWLMGGALAVALAALCGLKVGVPPLVRDITFVLIGMTMGSTVARESLSFIPLWPVTLLTLAVEMALIVALTGFMLQKLFGMDRGTAYLGSVPGHLSFVMGIAAAGVGDARQIVVIQVIRVLMMTAAVPIAALVLPIEHLQAVAVATHVMSIETFAFVALVCVAAGLIFVRLRVPAAYVLGSMIAAISLKLGGLYDGAMPPLVVTGTFIVIGGVIGQMFSGITMREFLRAAFGGVIATGMTVVIVTGCTWVASRFVNFPFGQIWMALAPGGIETMGALAITFGFDTAFVAAHHVVRLLYLTLALPALAVALRPRPGVAPGDA